MRALAAALLLLLAVPGAAAAQVDRSVLAGSLRASVQPDPWKLVFTGGRGEPVLAEAPGTGTGPTGTLGFATALGWFHATKVLSEARDGDAYTAVVATSDPTGTTLKVRLGPDAGGVIALSASVEGSAGSVQKTGVAFVARPAERYLGFGERSNAIDQRGGDVENYVSDGPYQPEERPFIGAAFVPAPGFRSRDDATYFPIPWLLSTAGYGVLVDNDETSMFRLTTDDPGAWSTEVEAPRIALRVFAGPRPAGVLKRMSARLGRQPRPAAPFYFGPWWQPPGSSTQEPEAKDIEAAMPSSVVQTYTHYLPCASQTGAEQVQRDRTARLHAAGLAVTTYFNPMICTTHPRYEEAKAKQVLTKNPQGQPYEYRYTGSSQFFVGQFDFTAPGVDDFFGSLFAEAVDQGYDGWMEDFGEYTPADARSADGTPGPAMHNRYVELYHRSARRYAERAPRPLARFNRSGWTGAAKSAQIVWGGDPTTDWGFDGLSSVVKQGLTMGLSGVAIWGSDIGGFFALGARKLEPELLVRWIELGFASGVMRTQANGYDLPDHGSRPQIFDPEILPVWHRYARLRTQLYPYLAAAAEQYHRSGMPLMRHLALVAPNDPKAVTRDDEFLLGDSLLVAPVLEPGATQRAAYLPAGRWVDLWRSTALNDNGSLRLGAPAVMAGRAAVTVPAPLAEIPLFVRVGAVLPLLPADVDTLASYGKAPGLVHLGDRRRSRTLLAFPRGRSRSALGPGETLRSVERPGRRWTLTVRGRLSRRYRLQASLGTLAKPFTPCSVRAGKRALPHSRWHYDSATRVLRLAFRIRRGALTVTACRRR